MPNQKQNGHRQHLQVGGGLIGQCVLEKQRMLITGMPTHTVPDRSELFQAVPWNVIVLLVLFEDRVKTMIEFASLSAFTTSHLACFEQLTTADFADFDVHLDPHLSRSLVTDSKRLQLVYGLTVPANEPIGSQAGNTMGDSSRAARRAAGRAL